MARRKVIIDTDPGVDDVLAILLALASPEELDVLLLSVTYGNIDVQNCLRNTVSVFHHIEKEWEWRRNKNMAEGFDSLKRNKPIIAVGAAAPLNEETLMADYFHGLDGLAGIHKTHPEMTPEETWRDLFSTTPMSNTQKEILQSRSLFESSKRPAHEEILRLLRENEPDTISIVVIGPMTNMAIAAATDTSTFLRAKEVVVMGGALDENGNITPVAEFNTIADTVAAARLFALTSAVPASTMPPLAPILASKVVEGDAESLPSYLQPYGNLEAEPRRLKLTLFPLDVTHRHSIQRGAFNALISSSLAAGSPMAAWLDAFLSSTFAKVESLSHVSGDAVKLDLHDPLTVWYMIDYATDPSRWSFAAADDSLEDIRVETAGQWTRGMMVVDRRKRRKRDLVPGKAENIVGDEGGWLINGRGNRVKRCTGSSNEDSFGEIMLRRILGLK